MSNSSANLFIIGVTIVALGAVAIGLSQIDSPIQARLQKLDAYRVANLQRLSMHIKQYWKAHNAFPDRLDQLNLPPKEVQDATTGQPYQYKIINATSYQLCALFDTTPNEDQLNTPYSTFGECPIYWWKHGKGQHCFTITTQSCK